MRKPGQGAKPPAGLTADPVVAAVWVRTTEVDVRGAPEAKIASKWGRGYHRSGPTGWRPETPGMEKLGEPGVHFKSDFSMMRGRAIGAFALTPGPERLPVC